jgi:signal transduction histidine kinase
MAPLVLLSFLVVALAAPVAYHVQKRHELLLGARADARRVATALRGEIEAGPRLWRYQSVKLSERLLAEGLGQTAALVIHDSAGVSVPIEGTLSGPSRRLIFGRAEVVLLGRPLATVWVGADTTPLWVGTLTLSAVFLALSLLLSTVLYVLPVQAVAAAEARVATLMARLALTLKEEERRRIARDLHDGAGQAITAARLRLLALRRTAGDDEAIFAIARHLDEALDEVRRSTQALAPPALRELGLFGALSRHCEAFSRATGLSVICEAEPGLPPVPPPIETASYRIIQEALTNIARHARARFARVHISASDIALRLEVSDDGVGLNGAATEAGEGQGLSGMRERAELLGGQVRFLRGEGQGTKMVVVLPIGPLDPVDDPDGPDGPAGHADGPAEAT